MGGSNNLFKVFTNPMSLVLKDSQSWIFDPIGTHLTQGVINWGNWITGKEEFGQHKDWWGMGEGHFGNEWMRKWTEGSKYKQWDAWEAKQVSQYDTESAKYYGKEKPKSPDYAQLHREAALEPKRDPPENKGTKTTTTVQDESLLSGSLSSSIY